MRLAIGKSERRMRLLVLLFAAVSVAIAQTGSPGEKACRHVGGGGVVPAQGSVPVLREIKDPSTGASWIIMRNPQHPAGPALLTAEREDPPAAACGISPRETPRLVIHAGDHLVVEEHTPAAESYLEAVAASAAIAGSALDVRLKIGGKVVRAVAIAPGRALMAPLQEAQP